MTIFQPPFAVVTPQDAEARFKAAGGSRGAGVPPVSGLEMQIFPMASVPQRPVFAIRPPALPGVQVPPPPLPPPVSANLPDNAPAARFRAAITAHQKMLGPIAVAILIPLPSVNVDPFKTLVLQQTDPAVRVAQWVKPMIRANGSDVAQETLDPIAWAPSFPQPMYEPLRNLSQDMIAPGLNDVPDNTVSLLKTNPRFVEAYMAGLNHEMARELLWRGYPTDQRGTYFQSFWDRRGVPTCGKPPPTSPRSPLGRQTSIWARLPRVPGICWCS